MSLTARQLLLSFRIHLLPKHTQISRFSSPVNLSLAAHAALLLGKDELFSSSDQVLTLLIPQTGAFRSLEPCWSLGAIAVPASAAVGTVTFLWRRGCHRLRAAIGRERVFWKRRTIR